MSVSTGRSSIAANGEVYVYAPPNSGVVNRGNSIVNGTYNQVNAGETATLSGIVQIPGGSGQLQVTEGGSLTYRLVTIVTGPVVTPGSTLAAPQTVGITGISQAASGYVYQPPNALSVPVGSQVSYGPPVTLTEAQPLPVPSIIEVEAGASDVQAVNLALWRQVTITPL